MNDFFQKNKFLVFGGLALSGMIVAGFYYFMNMGKQNIALSKFLEKYAAFIEDKLKLENNVLNLEIAAYIVNFISECEDYIFKQEYPELESERISNLDNENKHVYEELIFKTIEAQEKAFHESCHYSECRFGNGMADIKVIIEKAIKNNGSIQWRRESQKCKFPYFKEDLPVIERSELKKAFTEYANAILENTVIIAREIKSAQNVQNYQEIAMMNITTLKYRSKDSLKKKYKFDQKYFDILVANDEVLSKDPEILNLIDLMSNPKMENSED